MRGREGMQLCAREGGDAAVCEGRRGCSCVREREGMPLCAREGGEAYPRRMRARTAEEPLCAGRCMLKAGVTLRESAQRAERTFGKRCCCRL